jgi:hypothetical protein
MKNQIKNFSLILLSIFLLTSCGPSEEELLYKVNTISIASIVRAYYKKHNEYPDTLTAGLDNFFEGYDKKNQVREYKALLVLGEYKDFNGKGGWVYSPEKKYIQVNTKYKYTIHLNAHKTGSKTKNDTRNTK